MRWIAAYLAAGLSFGLLDFLWLRWAGPNLYRPQLGELLASSFRPAPAMVFYLFYIAGMVWFAVRPGDSAPVPLAVLNGALLGALCYATYDLTNQATMKTWPVAVTAIDIAWGAAATALASGIAALVLAKLKLG